MKISKKLIVVILAVLIGGPAAEWAIVRAVSSVAKPPIPGESGEGSYTVDRVIDGDTIVVHRSSGRLTVRALGIDTPETHDPRKPVQCFGPQASAYAERTLADQQISLSFDAAAGRLDKYGRTLAYIWLGRLLYNQEAIRLGYAHEYTYDQRHPYQRRAAFAAAQADAQTHHRGLWAPTTCDGDTSRPADNTNSKRLPPAGRPR